MAPLLLCGFGIVFLVVVVMSHGIDVVPDSVGPVLYALGLWRVAGPSRTLVVASALAAFAALVGLASFAPDALPESAEQAVSLTFSATVAGALALGAVSLGDRARGAGEPVVASQLLLIGVVQLLVLAGLAVGYALNAADHDQATAVIGAAGVVNVVVMLWYAGLLVICASHAWAQPQTADGGVGRGS